MKVNLPSTGLSTDGEGRRPTWQRKRRRTHFGDLIFQTDSGEQLERIPVPTETGFHFLL